MNFFPTNKGGGGGSLTVVDVAQGSSASSGYSTSYTTQKDGFLEAICDLVYNVSGYFTITINGETKYSTTSRALHTFYWKCSAGDVIGISVSSNSYYDINYLEY